MRERVGDGAGWMRDLVERDVGARLDGWGSGIREREAGGATWMGEYDERGRRERGWMDAAVG